MRIPLIVLGLGLSTACSELMPEVETGVTSTTTGSMTTGSTSTSTSTTAADSTTGDVCPPVPPDGGGYDACPGLCGGGGQCFQDGEEYGVCTRGCFMACDCWPSPGGEAPVVCRDDLLETTSVCALDCSGGQACPAGMICVRDLGICAHSFSGPGESTSSGGMEESTSSGGMESTSSGGMESTSSGGMESTSSGGMESTSSGGMESTSSGGMESTSSGGMESTSSGGESSSSGGSSGSTG